MFSSLPNPTRDHGDCWNRCILYHNPIVGCPPSERARLAKGAPAAVPIGRVRLVLVLLPDAASGLRRVGPELHPELLRNAQRGPVRRHEAPEVVPDELPDPVEAAFLGRAPPCPPFLAVFPITRDA
ncbi:hypothetical protein PG984_014532 [Apiospora sp. TS-2023a]